jgi:methyl-accepting chemotaxis protein
MSDQQPHHIGSLGRHSVAFRLWFAVATVVIALIAVIGFAGWRSNAVQQQANERIAAMDAKLDAAKRWAAMTTTAVIKIQAGAASSDPAVDAMYKDDIAATIREVNEVHKSIEAMDLSSKDKELMAAVAAARKSVLEMLAKIRALKASDPSAVQAEMTQRFNPGAAVYLKSLADFAAEQERARQDLLIDLASRRQATVVYSAIFIAVIVVGLVAGAVLLVRSIQRPLQQAIAAAEQVASGDLSTRIASTQKDEFGQLLMAIDRMVLQLRQVVGEVRQGVDSVATASSQIATGNHDLSARTEQTASSLQQTASSMEELTSTVGQSADTARQANQLAASAAEAATRGGQVVEQVITNMDQITESSRRIADIIGVIDGIAFQTNILALNAAVEAARAGEQGRGFAVVAGEVRSLAQRSADAAKEIKSLIGVSVDRVESGAKLVEQTGAAMRDIVSSVQRVTDLIGEIASAAGEQRDGIAQVNLAVSNLDQMTQQNAALVEESAAAAQSLREQAGRLTEVVSVFRLESGYAAPAPQMSGSSTAATSKSGAPSKPQAKPKPAGPRTKTAAPRPAAPSGVAAPAKSGAAAGPSPAPASKPSDDEWETF